MVLFCYYIVMKIQVLKKPYTDSNIEWNEETARYQLTVEFVKRMYDVCPIRNDSILQRKIKNVSRDIYHYIYTRCHTANRQVVNFLINNTENGRKFLQEVLECQMESELEYAYGDIIKVPVINVATGQEGNREAYKENAVSIATQQVLEDSAAYFAGINLFLQAPYPPMIFIAFNKFIEGE